MKLDIYTKELYSLIKTEIYRKIEETRKVILEITQM